MKEHATLPLLLKELRLPTMLKLWKSMSEEAESRVWTHASYLKELCEKETEARNSNKIKRYLRESKLLSGKTLDNYNFNDTPSLNKQEFLALSSGHMWLKDSMNVLLFGPSGAGKTHLANAIGINLVQAGYRVFFTRTSELLQHLQAANKEFALPSALNKLDKYDCLILDDFGYVKKDEKETSILFELICDKYERRSIVITCNQSFEEWDQIFPEKQMAIAAIDRLVHHSKIIPIDEESYRRRMALKRQQTKE